MCAYNYSEYGRSGRFDQLGPIKFEKSIKSPIKSRRKYPCCNKKELLNIHLQFTLVGTSRGHKCCFFIYLLLHFAALTPKHISDSNNGIYLFYL